MNKANKRKRRRKLLRSSDPLQDVQIIEEVIYGKIIVFGDTEVGKSSLIHRLANRYFTEQYTPTLTTEIFDITAYIKCENATHSRLRKFTTRGNEKSTIRKTSSIFKREVQYRKCFKFQLVDTTSDINQSQPMAYRANVAAAHGFMLICSFDNLDGLTYIKSIYEDINKMRKSKKVPILIVAGKSDLSMENAIQDSSWCSKNDTVENDAECTSIKDKNENSDLQIENKAEHSLLHGENKSIEKSDLPIENIGECSSLQDENMKVNTVNKDINDIELFSNSVGIKYCAVSSSTGDGFEELTRHLLEGMNIYNVDKTVKENTPNEVAFLRKRERDKVKKGGCLIM